MRIDTGTCTKRWKRIALTYNSTSFCMIGIIVTDMIRVLATSRHDHICCRLLAYIETFALTSATTDFSQSSHTITKGCMRIGLSYLSVMTRILFPIFRVSAYHVRMAFRNLLLRIAVTCYYIISTLMFRPIFLFYLNWTSM